MASTLALDYQKFFDEISLIAVIDHSGRAGNVFFLTLFDQHPEVLTCPWIHYTYSYIVTKFNNQEILNSKEAHSYVTSESYFQYVYQERSETIDTGLYKFGADPNTSLDRNKVKEVFDYLVLSEENISRKKLVQSMYLAYAAGLNRSLECIKYILVSDAPSLRTENVLDGFSGTIFKSMLSDFQNFKYIHLVRDPRACFASTRHQFVNSLGNIHDLRFGRFFLLLNKLLKKEFSLSYGCVFLFWLLYFTQTAKTVFRFKRENPEISYTIKNENINIYFIPTMKKLCAWLEVSLLKDWENEDYFPTMLGKPWAGTGAYNNRYQPNQKGLLKNDSPEASARSVAPNRYVTERWKTKLNKHEITILEVLFEDEMRSMDYSFLHLNTSKDRATQLKNSLFFPFEGEIPSINWIVVGREQGFKELFNRSFYLFTLWPFYIITRTTLYKYYQEGFFKNQWI
ncbi:MAG: hypothetical protein R3A13_01205 [Bdellovibrionota bacterium]